MSIPLKFGLFWAGGKLSYLRYLTFATLRHFHPDALITLCVSKEYDKSVHNWGSEKQDFESDKLEDYTDKLKDIKVNVVDIKAIGSPSYCPILQADLFRWIWMKENGGFYLDTDQIVVESFDSLPLDNEFIYCRYMEPQCGDYLPTGVLGLEKGSKIADISLEEVSRGYSPNNYNSSGPFMMRRMVNRIDLSRSFNAPFNYFYPINTSINVWRIYDNKFRQDEDSICVHWFGGHPLSQEFNNKYTEEFAKTSNDWISKFIRERGII